MENQRDFATITACGEDCTGCAKRAQGLCSGCRETDGYCPEWAQTGRCPIHACTRAHQALFCGLCESFPCDDLEQMMPWKPDAKTHLAALAQLYRDACPDKSIP